MRDAPLANVATVLGKPCPTWKEQCNPYMNCRITGEKGFLGRHIAKIVQCDYSDTRKPIDVLFHCAAKANVPYCLENRKACYDSNVSYLVETLEWAISNKVKAVVVASTDKVYGEAHRATEEHPLCGDGIYESSKVAADVIARAYKRFLKICVVRCGNFIGTGDVNATRIVPTVLRHVKEGTPIVLRGNGNEVRDFIHVEDAAMAFKKTAELLLHFPHLSGEAWNFSMERPVTMKEFIGLLAPGHEISFGTETSEIQHLSLDCAKARHFMAWQPKFTLESAVQNILSANIDTTNNFNIVKQVLTNL